MAKRMIILAGLLALAGGAAIAQTSDPSVEAARSQGIVGEQADGYLGLAKPGAGDLKARVDAVNIKRRAVYTDLAAKRGVTVNEVASATACELLQSRVGQGQAYRNEAGQWQVRSGAVQKPSFCP